MSFTISFEISNFRGHQESSESMVLFCNFVCPKLSNALSPIFMDDLQKLESLPLNTAPEATFLTVLLSVSKGFSL